MAQFIPAVIGAAVAAFATIALAPTIKVSGSRSETRIQRSSYGNDLTEVYGEAYRIAGNLIWLEGDEIREIVKTDTSGGKGGPKVKTTTYTYTATCLIALANKEARGIRRIWADSVLIYDVSPGADQSSIVASGSNTSEVVSVYLGEDTQEPIDRIIADRTSSPAYRELSSILFEDFDLAEYGNRIPNFTVELLPKNEAVNNDDKGLTVVDYQDNQINGNARLAVRYDEQTGTLQKGTALLATGATAIQVVNNYLLDGTRVAGTALLGQTDADGRDINAVYDPSTYTPWFGWIPANQPRIVYPTSYGGSGSDAQPPLIVPYIRRSTLEGLTNSYTFAFKFEQPNGIPSQYLINSFAIWRGKTFAVCRAGTDPDVRVLRFDDAGFRIGPEKTSADGVSDNTILLVDELASNSLPGLYAWELNSGTLYALDFELNTVRTFSVPTGLDNQDCCISNDTLIMIDANRDRLVFERLSLLGGREAWFETADNSYQDSEIVPVFPLNNVFSSLVKIYFFNSLYTDGNIEAIPTLDIVISQIMLANPQITAADFDVTDPVLATIPVQGYVTTSTLPVMDKLSQLLSAYNVYVIESGYKLVFKVRDATSVRTITSSDLVPKTVNGRNEWFTIFTDSANKLSRKMKVGYSDKDRGYDMGIQESFRVRSKYKNETREDYQIVLSGQEAADISARMLAEESLHGTKTDPFTLTYKHSDLEPGDVITVVYQNETVLIELTQVVYDAEIGQVECEGRVVTQDSINATGVPSVPNIPTNDTVGVLNLYTAQNPLDLPPLLDTDKDFLGFYVGASGFSASWQSAVYYKSLNAGESFSEVTTFVSPVGYGFVTAAPEISVDPNLIDNVSVLDVVFNSFGTTLTSVTDLDFYNGVNAAVILGETGIIGEIIYFQNAVLQGDGSTWRLTGLLRGVRGTEDQIANAADAKRIVILSETTIQAVSVNQSDLNSNLSYRAVTAGAYLQDSEDQTFQVSGLSQITYAPGNVRAYRPTNGDIELEWYRRPRVLYQWNDLTDVATVETSIEFDLEIMDGVSVVRTVSGLTTNSYTYTAADQTTDFGDVQASVTIRVYQLSDITGRGKVKEATV